MIELLHYWTITSFVYIRFIIFLHAFNPITSFVYIRFTYNRYISFGGCDGEHWRFFSMHFILTLMVLPSPLITLSHFGSFLGKYNWVLQFLYIEFENICINRYNLIHLKNISTIHLLYIFPNHYNFTYLTIPILIYFLNALLLSLAVPSFNPAMSWLCVPDQGMPVPSLVKGEGSALYYLCFFLFYLSPWPTFNDFDRYDAHWKVLSFLCPFLSLLLPVLYISMAYF